MPLQIVRSREGAQAQVQDMQLDPKTGTFFMPGEQAPANQDQLTVPSPLQQLQQGVVAGGEGGLAEDLYQQNLAEGQDLSGFGSPQEWYAAHQAATGQAPAGMAATTEDRAVAQPTQVVSSIDYAPQFGGPAPASTTVPVTSTNPEIQQLYDQQQAAGVDLSGFASPDDWYAAHVAATGQTPAGQPASTATTTQAAATTAPETREGFLLNEQGQVIGGTAPGAEENVGPVGMEKNKAWFEARIVEARALGLDTTGWINLAADAIQHRINQAKWVGIRQGEPEAVAPTQTQIQGQLGQFPIDYAVQAGQQPLTEANAYPWFLQQPPQPGQQPLQPPFGTLPGTDIPPGGAFDPTQPGTGFQPGSTAAAIDTYLRSNPIPGVNTLDDLVTAVAGVWGIQMPDPNTPLGAIVRSGIEAEIERRIPQQTPRQPGFPGWGAFPGDIPGGTQPTGMTNQFNQYGAQQPGGFQQQPYGPQFNAYGDEGLYSGRQTQPPPGGQPPYQPPTGGITGAPQGAFNPMDVLNQLQQSGIFQRLDPIDQSRLAQAALGGAYQLQQEMLRLAANKQVTDAQLAQNLQQMANQLTLGQQQLGLQGQQAQAGSLTNAYQAVSQRMASMAQIASQARLGDLEAIIASHQGDQDFDIALREIATEIDRIKSEERLGMQQLDANQNVALRNIEAMVQQANIESQTATQLGGLNLQGQLGTGYMGLLGQIANSPIGLSLLAQQNRGAEGVTPNVLQTLGNQLMQLAPAQGVFPGMGAQAINQVSQSPLDMAVLQSYMGQAFPDFWQQQQASLAPANQLQAGPIVR